MFKTVECLADFPRYNPDFYSKCVFFGSPETLILGTELEAHWKIIKSADPTQVALVAGVCSYRPKTETEEETVVIVLTKPYLTSDGPARLKSFMTQLCRGQAQIKIS